MSVVINTREINTMTQNLRWLAAAKCTPRISDFYAILKISTSTHISKKKKEGVTRLDFLLLTIKKFKLRRFTVKITSYS